MTTQMRHLETREDHKWPSGNSARDGPLGPLGLGVESRQCVRLILPVPQPRKSKAGRGLAAAKHASNEIGLERGGLAALR